MAQCRHTAEEELKDKKPSPPLQKVLMADGNEEEMPNEGHPDYTQALEVWQRDVSRLTAHKLSQTITRLGIVDDAPNDIEEIRAQYKEIGFDVDGDAKLFWVTSILAPADEDLAFLMFEIFGRSMAREAQVEFYRRMFRGHVPGKVNLEVAHTEGADTV